MWGQGDDGDTEVCLYVSGNVQADREKDRVQEKEGEPKGRKLGGGAQDKWRGWPETGDMLHAWKDKRKGAGTSAGGGNDDQLLLLFFSDVANAPKVKRLFRPIKGGPASPVKSILSCILKPTPSNSRETVSVSSGVCTLSGVTV